MKRNKPKLEKDSLTITMRLEAAALRQGAKLERDLRIAELLETAAQRIDDLEIRLRKRSVS